MKAKNHTTQAPLGGGSPIQLLDVINIVRQRWRLGLGLGLILAVAVATFMLSKPPQYRAQATMVVEINPEKMIQLNDVVKSNENVRVYDTIINAYLERLKSNSMADLVLESMTPQQLAVLERAYPDVAHYATEDGRELPLLAGRLQRAMQSSWNPSVQVVTISAVHGNPEVAKIVVDAYCDSFVQLQSNRQEERTSQILGFLEEQSEGLQAKLEEGEAQLQQYRSDQNLGSIKGSIDLVAQRLGQLSSAMTEKKVSLIAARNQLEQINAAEGELDQLIQIAFISGRPRISDSFSQLEDARSQQKILAETYGRRHPVMIENQATIDLFASSLDRAVKEAVKEIHNEYESIESGYASLQTEMKEAEAEALELDRLAIDYRVLERKLDVQRQIFDVVSEQFTTTDVSSQFDMASIRMLDQAILPDEPFSPNPKKAFVLAGFVFFACFLGLPVGLELLDNRLKTFADIEGYVGKPVYGDIHKLKGRSDHDLSQAVLNNDEMLSEAFRAIYSSLKLYTDCKPPYSLIVTSSLPSEGKTFVASNLAQTFARHQMKVLLIDCDLRRPSVHRQFKLKNDTGVITWVDSQAALPTSDGLLTDEHLGITKMSDNLFVLPSGGSTKQPTEIIGHERFDRLMSRLKDHFDVVITDIPPSGLFPDAALVADFAEQTLFVAKQNEVTRQKVRFAVNRLERTNAPVAGVVLNQISGNSVASGYGYYGQNYSYAYGYERDQSKYQSYYAEQPK